MATMKYPRLENQNREPILATLEYERRTNEERKKNTELQNLYFHFHLPVGTISKGWIGGKEMSLWRSIEHLVGEVTGQVDKYTSNHKKTLNNSFST